MKQKGFGSILIILIVFLIIGAGGFVFLNSSSVLKNSELKTSNDFIKEKVENKSSGKSFEKVTEEKLLFTGGWADATYINFLNNHILYVNKFGSGPSGYHAYTSKDGLEWKEYVGESMPQLQQEEPFYLKMECDFIIQGFNL